MFRVLLLTAFVCLVAGDQSRLEFLRDLLDEIRSEEMKKNAGLISEVDKLREEYEKVRSDNDPTMWCTAVYEGKKIIPGPSGEDYASLLPLFKDDSRVYAYVGLEFGDEMSRRRKFAFITWIGPRVSPLKKAKVSTDKAFVKQVFVDFGKEILADECNEVSEEKVRQILLAASGAAYGRGRSLTVDSRFLVQDA